MNHYHHCNNTFEKDISFYNNPAKGNEFIDEMYELGEKYKIKILPDKKPYLKKMELNKNSDSGINFRRCIKPFQNLNFYSNINSEKTLDVCACNRFFPFQIKWDEFGNQNINLIWNHPVLRYLRKTSGNNSICKFCRDKQTPYLRNLDNNSYRKLRNAAVKDFFSKARKAYPNIKPVKGLRILEKHEYGDFF